MDEDTTTVRPVHALVGIWTSFRYSRLKQIPAQITFVPFSDTYESYCSYHGYRLGEHCPTFLAVIIQQAHNYAIVPISFRWVLATNVHPTIMVSC